MVAIPFLLAEDDANLGLTAPRLRYVAIGTHITYTRLTLVSRLHVMLHASCTLAVRCMYIAWYIGFPLIFLAEKRWKLAAFFARQSV